MTHEAFRRRLEALEEARKLRDGEPKMISIGFRNGDGSDVKPTVARTSDWDFECFRREGEDEDAFRAVAEGSASGAETARKIPPSAENAMTALRYAIDEVGAIPPVSNHIPGRTVVVSVEQWRSYMNLAQASTNRTAN